MNVKFNISNEFNFSEAYGAMNRSGSLAMFTWATLCTRPTAVHTCSSINLRNIKFIS